MYEMPEKPLALIREEEIMDEQFTTIAAPDIASELL